MTKTRTSSRFTFALAALCASFVWTAAASAATTIRVAGNFAVDHSSSKAIEFFKKDVEKASGGQLVVETFPAMRLGGAQENVSQVRSGTLLMTWVGMAFLARTVPELEAVSLPFLFPTREVAFKVMDGKVGDLIDDKLAAKGFKSLGYMELGRRQLTNSKRPITSVEDMKGLKIRLQPIESHLATFRALGMNPVAMDIKEVYSALQQGVIDGQDNPFALIHASRFFEVQKYVSNTGQFFDFISVVANRKAFEALSPEFQKVIVNSMNKAITMQRAEAAQDEAKSLTFIQANGMTYTALQTAELAKMQTLTRPVIDQIKQRVGADLVDSVLSEVTAASK